MIMKRLARAILLQVLPPLFISFDNSKTNQEEENFTNDGQDNMKILKIYF